MWILLAAFGIIMPCQRGFAEEAVSYDSQTKRDPFVPLVSLNTKRSVGGLLGVESIEDIRVEGIALDADPGASVVVVNGSVLKAGDEVGGVKVISVRADGAEFSVNGIQGFKPLYRDEI